MREMFVGDDDDDQPKQTEYHLTTVAGIDWWAVFEETRGRTLLIQIRPDPDYCHPGNATQH